MSDAVTTTGILVQRADLATPAAFVTIGEITRVSPGGMSRNKIETSTHNDGSESHVLGILRQRDPQMDINYVAGNATHIQLLSDIALNTKAVWRVVFPSGKMRTGNGRLQMFEFDDAPVDAKQGAKCAWVWAGPVTES